MGKTRFTILFLALLLPAIQSLCQEDSLAYSDNGSDYKVESKFRDRNKAWYINGSGCFQDDHGLAFKYGLGFSFEYRLKSMHSIGAGMYIFRTAQGNWFSHGPNEFIPELYVNYRYYYNLNRRMRKGLTGNNFNADYFLLSPSLSFGYEPYEPIGYQWDFINGGWAVKYKSSFSVEPSIKIGYGIQRSFIKNLNFDINGGIYIRKGYYRDPKRLIYLQFRIGYIIK